MDEKSRQKVKRMLSEAISGFCRNMVEHRMHLSVEALVGITVDGSDVLLVNINEQYDKSSLSSRRPDHPSLSINKNTSKNCNDQYPNVWTQGDGVDVKEDTECLDNPTESLNESYFGNEEGASGDYEPEDHSRDYANGSRIKVEAGGMGGADNQYAAMPHFTEVIETYEQYGMSHSQLRLIGDTMGNRDASLMNNNANTTNGYGIKAQKKRPSKPRFSNSEGTHDVQQSEDCFYLQDDPEMSNLYETGFTDKNSHLSQDHDQYPSAVPMVHHFSGKTAKQGTPKKRSLAASQSSVCKTQPRRFKAAKISVVADNFEDGNEEWPVDSSFCPEPEVKVSRTYTCKFCNTQLSHLASYKRHMKTHQGVAFKCNGCGKYFSRADSLKLHQRKCAAAYEADDDVYC